MGQVVEVKVQRQVPQGIPEPPDGIAGIGIAFASDEDGNFSIHSLHPQGSAAACGQVSKRAFTHQFPIDVAGISAGWSHSLAP